MSFADSIISVLWSCFVCLADGFQLQVLDRLGSVATWWGEEGITLPYEISSRVGRTHRLGLSVYTSSELNSYYSVCITTST